MISPTLTNSAMAQSAFRVETDVFVEKVAEPVTQSVTLFLDGIAYDYARDENQDITLVDPARNRIVRFREAEEVRTEVEISKYRELLQAARGQAQNSPLWAYVLGAEKVDVNPKEISVGDELLRYRATVQEPDDHESARAYAQAYREFADASKLLNSFSTGGDPPFARLALNAAIQSQHALPKEITLSAKNGDKEIQVRCHLHATWLLSKDDRKRIADIQEMLVNYENVTPAEYFKRTQTARVASGPSSASARAK